MKRLLFILLLALPFFAFSQSTTGQVSQDSEGGGCIEFVGTRTQLLTERNADRLVAGCQYVITGYTRGCLTATRLVLTATDVDAFSMDVDVLTGFDTDYWEGRYDIGTNRMVELNDNIGNKVQGRSGNEVDRFPWGRANVYGNTVQNADVYFDCATTATIYDNSWFDNAFCDLRGFAGVYITNTSDASSRVYMNNATAMDFRGNKFQSLSYVYFSGGVSNVVFRYNTFSANSYVRKFTTATGRWTMYDSVVGRGDTRHYRGAAYNDEVNLNTGGRLYQRDQGTQDVRNTTISDLSLVDLQAAGGTTRIWRSNINSLSYLYVRAAVRAGNRYFYQHIQSQSTFDYRSGTANVTYQLNNQSSNGYVRWDNIQGTYNIYYNEISARAEHRLNGTSGTHSHYYNSIANYIGRINLRNCTGSNIQRTNLSADGRIDATGGKPTILYCDLSSIGIMVLTNYTGTIQRTKISSDSYVRLTTGGNMYACTFGTSFDFRSTGFTNSYVTGFGNITHTVAANNNNRGNFHNLVNNLN